MKLILSTLLSIHFICNEIHLVTATSFFSTSLTSSTLAFAASKKSNSKNKSKKKTNNIVGAGFGQSNQPKVEELEFPSRIPPNALEQPCPCGTIEGALYKDCCAPFHNKEQLPQSPREVLKTRYSAFAWRMPLYVIETTHSACRDFKKDKIKWSKELNRNGMFDSYDFVKLDVGEEIISEDDDGEGFIDFKVLLKANKSSGEHIEGQDILVQEKSRFLRTSDGGWKYAGGEVTSNVSGLEGTVLNN